MFLDTIVQPVWTQWESLARLLVAATLGAVVGLEREHSGKPAGFRTHLLICVGAALLTELSIRVAASADLPGGFRSDPGRIAAQIVSGIGFLGAGTIIQSRGSVVLGLTTAASLWVVAAIGMAVGAAQYVLALAATAVVMLALRLLGALEGPMHKRAAADRVLEIDLTEDPALLAELEGMLRDAGVAVQTLDVRSASDGYLVTYTIHATETKRQAALGALIGRAGVRRVSVR